MPLRELLLNVRLYYPHNLLATPPPPTHNKKRKKKKEKEKLSIFWKIDLQTLVVCLFLEVYIAFIST